MVQSIYHISEYQEEQVYPIICKCFDDLEVAAELQKLLSAKPTLRVLLKPNLIMAKTPDFPATTHPVIVTCVAKWLREHGVTDIVVADSPGGPFNREYVKGFYNTCKMTMVEPYAKLNDDFGFTSVDCPAGFANHSFNLTNFTVQADYIINLPKLKTHAMTGYSGGIKNLFGTIPGLQKPQLHYRWPDIQDFSNMLVELSQVVAPQITLIDAIDAMEGNGPTGGTSHRLNLILAARDFYTQDYFAVQLMGLVPEDIVMLQIATKKGLIHPASIELKGDGIPEGLTPFQKPDTQDLNFSTSLPRFLQKPAVWIMRHALKSYPVLEKEKCVGCGKCAESCPAQIIKIKNKKAVFQKKGCISCFCCQEMCPMKAIAVKKAL
jgi:uncharacterized protein (DUF362 family)/ferredoxin